MHFKNRDIIRFIYENVKNVKSMHIMTIVYINIYICISFMNRM